MELRLWQRREQLARRLPTATTVHHELVRLFVEVVDGLHSGWGEVTPLNSSIGGDPDVAQVVTELRQRALPTLVAIANREGVLPPWPRLHLLASTRAVSLWAHAAMEMALLNHQLVHSESTLEELWQCNSESVAEMSTHTLIDFDPTWQPSPRAQRVRVKTETDVDPRPWAKAMGAWNVPIILDFNTGARDEETVHDQLRALRDDVEIVAVEQPFAPGNLAAHAALRHKISVPVSLDEGVRSISDIRRIAQYEAATLICIKPARMGGVAVARSALVTARELGLRSYVGGFFESPVAREVHRALAASGDVEPSDVGVVDVISNGRAPYATRPGGVSPYPVPEGLVLLERFDLD